MVIDVLCAYLRMPYDPAPDPLPKNARKDQREGYRQRELNFSSTREVRHTVIRVIGNHLREPTRWRCKDYDFTGVVFDGADLSGACFDGGAVSFSNAEFAGGWVDFSGAGFAGSKVNFSSVKVTDGWVSFRSAQFTGGLVSFGVSKFNGGHVDFGHARFADAMVMFIGAEFAGTWVSFSGANFTRGLKAFTGGLVSFNGANFTGGEVIFDEARGICPVGLREVQAGATPGTLVLPEAWVDSPGECDSEIPIDTEVPSEEADPG